MKTKILFIAALAIGLSACGNPKKAAVRSAENTETTQPALPATFGSALRPDLQIRVGEPLRDTVTYLDFACEGDYYMVYVEKNDEEHCLLTDSDGWEINRGDKVEMEWKMDSMWVAGDGESLHIAEWATDMKRIEKGRLTAWKRDHHRPILWEELDDWRDDDVQRFREAVEWFLCNLTEEKCTEMNCSALWEALNYRKGELTVSIDRRNNENYNPERGLHPAVYVAIHDPYYVPDKDEVDCEEDSIQSESGKIVCQFGIRFDHRRFAYLLPAGDQSGFITVIL